MLPIILAAVLSHHRAVAPSAPLRFQAERTSIGAGGSPYIEVQNIGTEVVRDLILSVTLPPQLQLRPDPYRTNTNWTCTPNPAGAICTLDELQPRQSDVFIFTIYATSGEGGHVPATMTLRARTSTVTQTITFDVNTPHIAQVTSTADSGPGTLRALIEEANANPLCGTDVFCLISFLNVPFPAKVAPLTPLPAIRKCNLRLDGFDPYEVPFIVKNTTISGENAREGNGLEVRAACAPGIQGVVINGFAIHSWPENGIAFFTPSPTSTAHVIGRTYLGTDAAGKVAKPNGLRGVGTYSPYDVVGVSGGIASGNTRSGIAFFAGSLGFVSDMKIGVDRDGQPLGNGAAGVFSHGVPLTVQSSTIAYNADFGVAIDSTTKSAFVVGNSIHDNTGLPIDWGLDGRTPPDDETDGVLNSPQLLNAFFDPVRDQTVVRGVARLRGGEYVIDILLATSTRGDSLGSVPRPGDTILIGPGEAADLPFEVRVNGDLRGKLLAAQTQSRDRKLTSEISEAIEVK